MINETIEYLDGEHSVIESTPNTIQELIDLIGEQAVVDETVSNLYYRNKYPRVYRKVSAELAAKFPRPQAQKNGEPVTKTKKQDGNEVQVPVYVSEMDHLREYEKTGEEAKAEVDALFQKHGPAEPLFVKGERTGGGGKVSKAALDGANSLFATSEEAVENAASYIEGQIPGLKIDRESPESLARGIQSLQKKMESEAKAKAKTALGLPA